jgi:hypothetical protein
MGRGGCQVEEQGVRAASIGRVPVGRRASRGGGGGRVRSSGARPEERERGHVGQPRKRRSVPGLK